MKYWGAYCKSPNNFFLASSSYTMNCSKFLPRGTGFCLIFWLEVGFPEDPLTQMSSTSSPSEEICILFPDKMRGEKSCSKINLSDLFQSSTLGVLQVVFLHIFCSWNTQPDNKVQVTLECCVSFVAEQVCLSDPFNLFHFFRTQEAPLKMTH